MKTKHNENHRIKRNCPGYGNAIHTESDRINFNLDTYASLDNGCVTQLKLSLHAPPSTFSRDRYEQFVIKRFVFVFYLRRTRVFTRPRINQTHCKETKPLSFSADLLDISAVKFKYSFNYLLFQFLVAARYDEISTAISICHVDHVGNDQKEVCLC